MAGKLASKDGSCWDGARYVRQGRLRVANAPGLRWRIPSSADAYADQLAGRAGGWDDAGRKAGPLRIQEFLVYVCWGVIILWLDLWDVAFWQEGRPGQWVMENIP